MQEKAQAMEERLQALETQVDLLKKEVVDCNQRLQKKSCFDLRQRNRNIRQGVPFYFEPDRLS